MANALAQFRNQPKGILLAEAKCAPVRSVAEVSSYRSQSVEPVLTSTILVSRMYFEPTILRSTNTIAPAAIRRPTSSCCFSSEVMSREALMLNFLMHCVALPKTNKSRLLAARTSRTCVSMSAQRNLRLGHRLRQEPR